MTSLDKALHFVRASRLRLQVYGYSFSLQDLNRHLAAVHTEFPCQASFDAMALPHCDSDDDNLMLEHVESELLNVS